MQQKIVIALLGLVCFLLACCQPQKKGETKMRVYGYQGLAATNPYLAAQRYINAEGFESEVSPVMVFDRMKFDTLIIPASSISGTAQAEQILDFISGGGHVICTLENGEKNYQDFDGWKWGEYSEMDAVEHLMGRVAMKLVEVDDDSYSDSYQQSTMQEQELRVYPVPSSQECVIALSDELPLRVELGGEWRIRETMSPTRSADHWYAPYIGEAFTDTNESHDTYQFVSKEYNNGRLSVISDARWLRNPHIAGANHATFLKMLLNLHGGESILFSYGKTPNFFQLVWRDYPLVILGLLLLFLLWMVSKSQRFGPVLEIVYQQPLNFLKSVEANGHFLWGRNKRKLLISSMQTRAIELERLPNFLTGDDRGELNQLAETLDVSPEALNTALYSPLELEPTQFIESVKLLQRIIKHHE